MYKIDLEALEYALAKHLDPSSELFAEIYKTARQHKQKRNQEQAKERT